MQKKKFRVTGTLNRDDPTNPVEEDEIEELEEIEEMGVGRWQIQEVKEALRKTKPGKAVRWWSGLRPTESWHGIHLKYRLWETKRWPEVWKKRLMSWYSRKMICVAATTREEWILLPIISKIFCKMLLKRIKERVDKKLWEEQATDVYIRKHLRAGNQWRTSLYRGSQWG